VAGPASFQQLFSIPWRSSLRRLPDSGGSLGSESGGGGGKSLPFTPCAEATDATINTASTHRVTRSYLINRERERRDRTNLASTTGSASSPFSSTDSSQKYVLHSRLDIYEMSSRHSTRRTPVPFFMARRRTCAAMSAAVRTPATLEMPYPCPCPPRSWRRLLVSLGMLPVQGGVGSVT
jgi:hypothetical protein